MAYSKIKEIQKQTEIQQRPFVIFEIKGGSGSRFAAILKNVGNGIAFNIKIRDITVSAVHPHTQEYIDSAHKIKIDQEIYMLKKDESYEIDHSNIKIIETNPAFGIQHSELTLLHSTFSQSSYTTIIEFQNIEMDWHYIEQETNPAGIVIVNSGRLKRQTTNKTK